VVIGGKLSRTPERVRDTRTTAEKQTENPRATTRQQRGGQVFGLVGGKHGLFVLQPLQVLDLGKTAIEPLDLWE